jgi:xylose isomerase
VNHATLAGHTFQHELQVAVDSELPESMDANRVDYQNWCDTDQFPNNINELVGVMLIILKAGGFKSGGINFDARRRRNSIHPGDLFYAHICGIDIFARALIIKDNILSKSAYKKLCAERYASFDKSKGKEFEEGKLSLEYLRNYAAENGEPEINRGKQEFYQLIIDTYYLTKFLN